MSHGISGVVHNGVIVPHTPLPEGAQVEIRMYEALGQRFGALAEEWRSATAHLSNIRKRILHPAYQEIIGMGASAIPLILAEMKRRPGQWFWALQAITGEDPTASHQHGNLTELTEAWLEWGRRNGYPV